MNKNDILHLSERIEKWDKIYQRDGKRYGEHPSKFCMLLKLYLQNCKNVLELGCGYGRDLLHLATHYPSVNFFGIDSSPTAISILLGEVRKRKIKNLKVLTSNWLDSIFRQFKKNPIDLIFSHFFLHLFLEKEREEILKRTAQILKDGGIFINSLVSKNDAKFGKGKLIEKGTYAPYSDRSWHYLHFWTYDEIIDTFSKVGFKVEELFEYVEEEEILENIENTITWFVVTRKIREIKK